MEDTGVRYNAHIPWRETGQNNICGMKVRNHEKLKLYLTRSYFICSIGVKVYLAGSTCNMGAICWTYEPYLSLILYYSYRYLPAYVLCSCVDITEYGVLDEYHSLLKL